MNAAILLEAWGFTLVHFCWQGAALAALYKLSEWAMPALQPGTRYVLALAALIAMPTAATVTFISEIIRLTPDATTGVVPGVAFLPDGASDGLTLQNLLPWIEAGWLLGVMALSCRMLTGLYMIQCLKNNALRADESMENRFVRAVKRVGLGGKVRLRLQPGISDPFVVGAFRSVIYLPVSAVTALTPDQLDAVLAHELEHVRRADYAWNLVQNVIETVFFFHPAVWWLGATLREQRELCCDDAALQTCADPLTYATALLSLEEQRRTAPRLAVALNGPAGKGLVGRIARMLGETGPAARPNTRPLTALVLPVVLLVLGAAVTPVAQVAASADSPSPVVRHETINDDDGHHHSIAAESASMPEQHGSHAVEAVNYHDGHADIDPDAIAEQVRAGVEVAQAGLEAGGYINADAIAGHVEAQLRSTKAELERAGIMDHGIDPEAIAAEVRAELVAAQAEIAAARALDADAIAEEARRGARQAQQEMKRHRLTIPPSPPEPVMEVPAPLAGPEDVLPPPPVASLTPPAVPSSPTPARTG